MTYIKILSCCVAIILEETKSGIQCSNSCIQRELSFVIPDIKSSIISFLQKNVGSGASVAGKYAHNKRISPFSYKASAYRGS